MGNSYLPYDDWDQRWSQFLAKKAEDKARNEITFIADRNKADAMPHNKLNKCWLEDQWQYAKGGPRVQK